MLEIDIPKVNKLFNIMGEQNLSVEDVMTLIQIASKQKTQKQSETNNHFILPIDHDLELDEIIRKANLGHISRSIKYYSSSKKTGKENVIGRLFKFESGINAQLAKQKMKKLGYRPANIIELLTTWTIYKGLLKNATIIAIDPISLESRGFTHIPTIGVQNKKHGLYFKFCARNWSNTSLFLGIYNN